MLTPQALTAAHRRANSIEFDGLTGLGNLFAFLRALKQGVPQVAVDKGELLTAALFSIDNLADIQAILGEEATDYVVATISSTLYRAMPVGMGGRRTARLFRIAGDEFAMLLRHNECEHVQQQVESMQQQIANLDWENYSQKITVSASITCYPTCANSAGELLAYTNYFMQSAKSSAPGSLACSCGQGVGNQAVQPLDLQRNAASLVEILVDRILETAEQLQQTTKLAMSDPLTGLPNLRATRQALREQLEYSKQMGTPLALLLVDGDRLKEYNQRFGYAAGNQMIRWLARALQQWCGADGYVSRWLSGDEFMLILPNRTGEQAMQQAGELCNFVFEASKELMMQITISIGIAGFPETADTAQQLIDAVEGANQRAKDGGRNRASL